MDPQSNFKICNKCGINYLPEADSDGLCMHCSMIQQNYTLYKSILPDGCDLVINCYSRRLFLPNDVVEVIEGGFVKPPANSGPTYIWAKRRPPRYKLRPCRICDVPFRSAPNNRVCPKCRRTNETFKAEEKAKKARWQASSNKTRLRKLAESGWEPSNKGRPAKHRLPFSQEYLDSLR